MVSQTRSWPKKPAGEKPRDCGGGRETREEEERGSMGLRRAERWKTGESEEGRVGSGGGQLFTWQKSKGAHFLSASCVSGSVPSV